MLAFLKIIIFFNVLLLAGTFILQTQAIPRGSFFSHLLRQSDLGAENIFASWYSSALLFLCAIMSFVCYLTDERRFSDKKNTILNYGWVVFALCFSVLSFDEMGSVHEYIGDFLAFEKAGHLVTGEQNSGWTIFYFLIGLVSLFMLMFSILRLRLAKFSLIFLILGLLLYLSNPIQENYEIESLRAAVDPNTWKRPVYFILLEEGSEVFGSLFFLIALCKYPLSSHKRPAGDSLPLPKEINIVIRKSVLIRSVYFFILLLVIGMVLIKMVFGDVDGQRQVGVPKNWITSIFALSISLYSLYRYKAGLKLYYLALCVFALGISIYYGCDRFSYLLGDGYSLRKTIVYFVMLISGLFCFGMLSAMIKGKIAIAGFIVSFMILSAAVLSGQLYSAELALLSFSCLLLTLIKETSLLPSFNKGTAEQ